jgi:predicted aminopeptidase
MNNEMKLLNSNQIDRVSDFLHIFNRDSGKFPAFYEQTFQLLLYYLK